MFVSGQAGMDTRCPKNLKKENSFLGHPACFSHCQTSTGSDMLTLFIKGSLGLALFELPVILLPLIRGCWNLSKSKPNEFDFGL